MCRGYCIVGILSVCVSVSQCLFSPNVTVTSCNSRRVVVELVNAADDGIIFIQGRDTTCRYETVAETKNYEFDFDRCDIVYDSKFRVVVQRHSLYMTGFDKVIPVMCLVDTSDLFVSGVVFPDEGIGSLNGVNKTVKPTVRMRISAGSGQTMTSSEVTEVNLNDNVQLSLILDDMYMDDFDIKAKDCRAEMISLIQEECSEDEGLFPNFEKQTTGSLQTAFQAFRPTNVEDDVDEVDVAFTCNVAVCKGQCHNRVCGQIVGWGRKRRADEDNDDVIEKVTCATKLKVKVNKKSDELLGGMYAKLQGEMCVEKVAVVSVMTVTIFTLIVSWIVCACVTMRLRSVTRSADPSKKPNPLRRLSEMNVNFARSVGRRLSTMLNLPVGYNVKDRKMADDFIPAGGDETPPTKRRDSVTVREPTKIPNSCNVNDALDIESTNKSESRLTLRKRYVNIGVQVGLGCDNLAAKKPTMASKDPHSFITSISIKSGISKKKMDQRSESLTASQYSNGNTFLDKPTARSIKGAAKSFDYLSKVGGACLQRTANVDLSFSPNSQNYLGSDYVHASFDSDRDIYDTIDARSKASENDTDLDSVSLNSNQTDGLCKVDTDLSRNPEDPINFVSNAKLVRKYSTQV